MRAVHDCWWAERMRRRCLQASQLRPHCMHSTSCALHGWRHSTEESAPARDGTQWVGGAGGPAPPGWTHRGARDEARHAARAHAPRDVAAWRQRLGQRAAGCLVCVKVDGGVGYTVDDGHQVTLPQGGDALGAHHPPQRLPDARLAEASPRRRGRKGAAAGRRCSRARKRLDLLGWARGREGRRLPR